jgi:hypothetical protein
MAFSMQDLMAGLPGSQPSNPFSPTANPLINPQIDRKQLAGDVANIKSDKNQKLGMMLYALGGALKGDKNFVQNTLALEQMQEGKKKKEERNRLLKQFAQDPANKQKMPWLEDVYTLLGDKASDTIADNIVKSYQGVDDKILEDVQGVKRYASGSKMGQRVFPEVEIPVKGASSDPLRTVTIGGKVDYNIRDSKLTDDKVKEINESGAVIQPLGFTEKFESSKDVDFGPVKNKYLATENIIIKTSELAQKFVDEPSSALAIGGATQFIDGIIQNIDVTGNLLSNAKNKRAYKYMQETSTSLEGKDFTDAIKKASRDTGVADSRIRDLAYLFAAARGQEGRGLSDKDYENALKIVAGGVGPAGRSAVLKDVSNSLRDEFYRGINLDIATSENQAYVDKLKKLPELPYYVDPIQQTPPPTIGGPRRIRRPVPTE